MALQLLLAGPLLLEIHRPGGPGPHAAGAPAETGSDETSSPHSHEEDPAGHDCRVCALVLGAPVLPGGPTVLAPAVDASLFLPRTAEEERVSGHAVRRPPIRGPPGRA